MTCKCVNWCNCADVVKAWVRKTPAGQWVACVTRGYSGNYEDDYWFGGPWRDAFDWAYNQVKNWS